ncbi:MAG: 3-deoxy-D-manno-octulosonic acid kinase [Nevskiaceae bacterium]
MAESGTGSTMMSRLESGDSVMLYDPFLCGNFTAEWFSPRYWQHRGALAGAAPGRGSTWFFATEGREYALRHYRRGGLIGRFNPDWYLGADPQRSRPFREFSLLQQCAQAGLPVATVVAARFLRAANGYRGDLLTLRVPGARTLATRLREGGLSVDEWRTVGGVIGAFHQAGIWHADLNAHNILFDAEGAVRLIDFDRGRVRPPGWWKDANLARVRRSLCKVADATPAVPVDEAGWAALLDGYFFGIAERAVR